MSLVKDMYLTLSHFKIPLAEPLNFHDPHNWEVSLSELYFPSSYYNISQDNDSNLTIQYHIKGVVHTKHIPQGHYDPASYMKEVNKEIKKSNANSQQPVSQKYSLKLE